MSRRRKRKLPPPAILNELLHGECFDWPNCRCGTQKEYWARNLASFEDTSHLSDAEFREFFEDLCTAMACMLSCVAHHCPDRSERRWALGQLIHPFFADIVGGSRWRN